MGKQRTPFTVGPRRGGEQGAKELEGETAEEGLSLCSSWEKLSASGFTSEAISCQLGRQHRTWEELRSGNDALSSRRRTYGAGSLPGGSARVSPRRNGVLSSEELGPSPRPRPLLPKLVLTHRFPNSPPSAEDPRAHSEGPRHGPSSCHYPGRHRPQPAPNHPRPVQGLAAARGTRGSFLPCYVHIPAPVH